MVRMTLRIALCFVLLAALPARAHEPASHDGRGTARVMTQNLYFGADLGPVLAATDASTLIAAVTTAFASAEATDIPARMAAVADEIGKTHPDLIGLQEAALWRTGPLGTPATEVAFDFVSLLVDALAARGLTYEVAVTTTNLDAQAPGVTASGLREIRLTDRDAILVRRGAAGPAVDISSVQSANFATNVVLSTPVLGHITILRGWAAVDVTIGHTSLRFRTTHLETLAEAVQVAQAVELLDGPAATGLPLVMVCDCNSDARGRGADATATYGILIEAGLTDAWAVKRPGAQGLTCCQASDLRNRKSALNERIDLVLLRGSFDVRHARVIGAHPADRTPPPTRLWPSDHAGLAVTLELPGGR
jgi:endonuclease/exonuclease/phosphatase family metal-dependent hydrolase